MIKRCPLCQRRRARRTCPALEQNICGVCCGTKRLTEINCPPDCNYLASARAHPPAAVQRQQERDLRFLLPMLQDLTEEQRHLLLMIQTFLQSDQLSQHVFTDDDVANAVKALADTYDTESRGIIYEHIAEFPSANRLKTEIKAFVEIKQNEGIKIRNMDMATVMRRIEKAAHEAQASLPGDKTAYLEFLKRVLKNPTSSPIHEPSNDKTDTGNQKLIISSG